MFQKLPRLLPHWTPAFFCTFISYQALFGSIDPAATWWKPAFFAFLPMSFFFMATVTVRLQGEIQALRDELAELRKLRLGSTESLDSGNSNTQ